MVSWNVPVTFPLKFPLRMNDPVPDPPDAKQGVAVVKLRFVTLTTMPLFWLRDVLNAKAGAPVGSDSAAVQLPFMLFELLEFPPPHAPSISPSTRSIAIPSCFMSAPFTFRSGNKRDANA
jgi:hypothetical protein